MQIFLKRFCCLLAVITACMALLPISAHADAVSASSAYLFLPQIDAVLYEKDANTRRPMASTTKIMTALVALESMPYDALIRVPKEATGIEGTSTYLEEGEILSLEHLLYALMLQSANDAAATIAIAIDGSIEVFAERMNNRAKEMGLVDTHFTNPHGLPDAEHYTTAKELAMIAACAMQNELFRTIVSTQKISFDSSLRRRYLTNHNKLLRLYPDAVGIKTGFTKKSGRCLVGAAEQNGMLVIAVTLDAPSDWHDHMVMFDSAFAAYENKIILQEQEIAWNIPVINGVVPFVTVKNEQAFSCILPQNTNDIWIDIDIPSYPIAPIRQGDILGYVRIYRKDEEIVSLPLTASNAVPSVKPTKKKLFGLF